MAVAAAAQDFQQSYRLAAGGSVRIGNVSGHVKVTGYDGDAIVVTGFKEGRDRERVWVEDLSGGDRVEIKARYPEQCRNCNASINFEVKVPRGVNYRYESISSVSGEVEVYDVTGDLQAKSVSGNVTIKGAQGAVTANSVSGHARVENVVGTVNAKSVSGNVEVEITRLQGGGNMDFSSVSGNVTARMPADLGATVDMSVMSGDIKTDFPLEIEKQEYGPRRSARGAVGDGARRLKMSSLSGSVSLLKN
jgi:hypothetical protein